MRQTLSLLVAMFAFFVISVVGLSAADPAGKPIYEKNCKACHGSDAKGDSTVAIIFKIDLARLNLTDKETSGKKDRELIKNVTEGNGKMKGFKSRLKPEEIAEAIKYIRSLKE